MHDDAYTLTFVLPTRGCCRLELSVNGPDQDIAAEHQNPRHRQQHVRVAIRLFSFPASYRDSGYILVRKTAGCVGNLIVALSLHARAEAEAEAYLASQQLTKCKTLIDSRLWHAAAGPLGDMVADTPTASMEYAECIVHTVPQPAKGPVVAPCSSICQMHSNKAPVSLADLPKPWLAMLVSRHLTNGERRILFQTCTGLASVVVQHCNQLTLQPAAPLLQDTSRRGYVLTLASGCHNIHLRLHGHILQLDTPAVWPRIKQLTLCNVAVSCHTIATAQLPQLTHLHTIAFAHWHPRHWRADSLDVAALGRVIQAGGLPGLQTLRWEASDLMSNEGQDRPQASLRQLSTVLGPRITHLVLRRLCDVVCLSSWPKVTMLTVLPQFPAAAVSGAVADELFSHTRLRHVSLPNILWHTRASEYSSHDCKWEVLDLPQSASTSTLARLPLHSIKHVNITRVLICDGDESCTLRNLARCKDATWIPVTGAATGLGLSPTTPVFFIKDSWDPQLISACSQRLRGALLLRYERGMNAAVVAAVSCIGPGIHTLILSGLHMLPGHSNSNCPWQELLWHLPNEVTHLVLDGVADSVQVQLHLFDLQPPNTLSRLTLANSSYRGGHWLSKHECELQAAAAVKWPTVQLHIAHAVSVVTIYTGV